MMQYAKIEESTIVELEGAKVVKQMQGVTLRQPVKGRADVSPRMVLQAKGDSSFAVATADASKIINFLIVPVIQVNKKMKSSQEVRDGWDRVLKDVDFSETQQGSKPLILSARKNWKIHQDQINIIETAYLLDGAKYLEYLQKSKNIKNIPLIILFDKTEDEELSIRKKISESGTFSIHDIKNKVGTDAPRMTISEVWREIKIISDPFVIKTGMGYTAAINVLETKTNTIHHIIVGAKSLSNELELIRSRIGSLSNIQMKIRKQSSDPKSPYEIKI
jgi:hypothetical protein